MLINTTPHSVTILDADGTTVLTALPPSGLVLRVSATDTAVGDVGGIPIFRTTYGAVTATRDGQPVPVPAPQDGVYYVVSALVRLAAPDRQDFLSPGALVRGADGQPVGCKGLTRS